MSNRQKSHITDLIERTENALAAPDATVERMREVNYKAIEQWQRQKAKREAEYEHGLETAKKEADEQRAKLSQLREKLVEQLADLENEMQSVSLAYDTKVDDLKTDYNSDVKSLNKLIDAARASLAALANDVEAKQDIEPTDTPAKLAT